MSNLNGLFLTIEPHTVFGYHLKIFCICFILAFNLIQSHSLQPDLLFKQIIISIRGQSHFN